MSRQSNSKKDFIVGEKDTKAICPASDCLVNLGTASSRFNSVFVTNGVITTSDGTQKINVANINLGMNFLTPLRPVQYNYVWDSTKLHTGLIAQEVETVLDSINRTNQFAGLEKNSYLDENNNMVHSYGLNYSAFVPVLIKANQELAARIAVLESAV